jgi:hypothetical protein
MDSPTKLFLGNLDTAGITETECREIITAFGNLAAYKTDTDARGRGLHSSKFQLNLSRFGCHSSTSQRNLSRFGHCNSIQPPNTYLKKCFRSN